MKKFGGRSLELTDGSGYAGSLEVYHDLHCLVLHRSHPSFEMILTSIRKTFAILSIEKLTSRI